MLPWTMFDRRWVGMVIVDEFSRECLSIDVARRLTSEDVLCRLSELFCRQGVPRYIRSDNGPEFTAKAARAWLKRVGGQTLFIEPGSETEPASVGTESQRTDTSNRSTASSLMNYSTARSSTRSWRQRYSSIGGEWSTTRDGRTAHWATGPPRPRRFWWIRRLSLRSSLRIHHLLKV